MKLVLSNGTPLEILHFEKGTVTVSGNTVASVTFTIAGQSLNSIRSMFGVEDNLIMLNIYDDRNKLMTTFDGYQKRAAITIADDDTTYKVTLAKTSNASEMTRALESRVKDLESRILENIGVVETVNEQYKQIAGMLSTITKEQQTYATNVQQFGESVRIENQNVRTLAGKIDAAYRMLAKNDASYKQSMELLTTATNAMKQLNQAVTTTNEASMKAVSRAEEAEKAVKRATTSVELATKDAERLRTKTIRMDQDIDAAGKTVETLKKAKTVSDKKIQDLATDATKTAADLKQVVTKQSTLSQNQESTEREVRNIKTATTEVKQNIEKIDERVTSLEPITDYTTLPLEAAKIHRVAESKEVLAEYLAAHPITSSCHGEEGVYSITSEKSTLLQGMILTATLAQQAGIEYQPSWNETGKQCTYDWTIEQLTQLGMEIEQAVRPLVSYQQSLESAIMATTTMEELQQIFIDYDSVNVHVSAGDAIEDPVIGTDPEEDENA